VAVDDLDAVFRRFAPYVARIGARILGRADEVDDLVQDVFLDAMRGLRALREVKAIRGWLATVTVRHARRRLRRRAMWSALGLDRGHDLDGLVATPASPETRAELLAVYRALDGVPADARIAWVLSEVEGHSLDEVAAIGGYSRATAHRRVEVARTAVEAALRG
jgi:RNA polymerase sigma-70 factor (ECF subfamily)